NVVASFENVPAVENDLRRTVGHVVAVAVGDEEQVRRGTDPDAAEAELDAGDVGDLVMEDFASIKMAVAVFVLEDKDAILARFAVSLPLGIGVVLRDPEPAAVVDGEGD